MGRRETKFQTPPPLLPPTFVIQRRRTSKIIWGFNERRKSRDIIDQICYYEKVKLWNVKNYFGLGFIFIYFLFLALYNSFLIRLLLPLSYTHMRNLLIYYNYYFVATELLTACKRVINIVLFMTKTHRKRRGENCDDYYVLN